MPNVIRLNDPTSHGGKVSKVAATHFTVGGLAVACVGDTVLALYMVQSLLWKERQNTPLAVFPSLMKATRPAVVRRWYQQ